MCFTSLECQLVRLSSNQVVVEGNQNGEVKIQHHFEILRTLPSDLLIFSYGAIQKFHLSVVLACALDYVYVVGYGEIR